MLMPSCLGKKLVGNLSEKTAEKRRSKFDVYLKVTRVSYHIYPTCVIMFTPLINRINSLVLVHCHCHVYVSVLLYPAGIDYSTTCWC